VRHGCRTCRACQNERSLRNYYKRKQVSQH
jgi:hypothetical protein